MMAEYSQTYWNELIDQYRDGSISDQDRYKLEKEALDDPFLFDTLEGFSLHEDAVEEVTADKKSSKIFTLPRIAAAASIVLLVAFLFNLKMNSRSEIENNDKFAMVFEDEEAAPTKEKREPEINATGSTQPEPKFNNEAKNIQTKNNNPSTSPIVNNNKTIKENKPSTSNEPPASMSPTIIAEAAEAMIEESENDVIAAIDKNNTKDEAISTTTSADVVVDVSGAVSSEREAADQEEVLIVPVVADADLKKEVKAKRKKSEIRTYFEAVPVIGKEIFDDYAKGRIDKRGLRQEKPQEVTIEFTIDENGNVSNFHHIFTGCSECGPFAISILQKSGEWKTVPPGFSGRARYTFVF